MLKIRLFLTLLMLIVWSLPGVGAWDVVDAVTPASLPDWDSSAFESAAVADGKNADDLGEDEIEKGAQTLRRELVAAPAEVPVALDPVTKDNREILFTFAASREIEPSRARVATQSSSEALPTAHLPEGEAAPGELALHLKSEKRVLPRGSLMALSDERLIELCADLREATHLTIDASPGATIRNFTQRAPLLLRVKRLGDLENLRARFVALVGGGQDAKIRRLRSLQSPHLVCDVRLSSVEGIEAPLILVGGSLPRSLEGHPRIRRVGNSF
ncbi:MAG: hypothetical protein KF767_15990 [Bdellovibrionaceae bacterium]|nr:hypothetical protein [Pseudobdellovibrionaceae bacterium]